jgi:hypothetical protein
MDGRRDCHCRVWTSYADSGFGGGPQRAPTAGPRAPPANGDSDTWKQVGMPTCHRSRHDPIRSGRQCYAQRDCRPLRIRKTALFT